MSGTEGIFVGSDRNNSDGRWKKDLEKGKKAEEAERGG